MLKNSGMLGYKVWRLTYFFKSLKIIGLLCDFLSNILLRCPPWCLRYVCTVFLTFHVQDHDLVVAYVHKRHDWGVHPFLHSPVVSFLWNEMDHGSWWETMLWCNRSPVPMTEAPKLHDTHCSASLLLTQESNSSYFLLLPITICA